jgi:hypothetical protein
MSSTTWSAGGLRTSRIERNESNLVVETRDILDLAPADKLFAGAEYIFHFAGIGDMSLRSTNRSIICPQT